MAIKTRWFRIDFLASKKDGIWPGWRWRPRLTRPWERGRALTWGNWHLVVTRRPNASERRQMRRDYWEVVRWIQSWAEDGWEAAQ